jgi:hypothetical protein
MRQLWVVHPHPSQLELQLDQLRKVADVLRDPPIS